MVYPVQHKFVLTRKLIWFVHTSLGRQFFSDDCITIYFSWHEPTDTDPACVISVDCARGFALLRWLNLRYGLKCFVFYGCIVVYPVPHKSVLTRKLIWPVVCTYKFRSTSMSHTIAINGGHLTQAINCQRHLIFKMADKNHRSQRKRVPCDILNNLSSVDRFWEEKSKKKKSSKNF